MDVRTVNDSVTVGAKSTLSSVHAPFVLPLALVRLPPVTVRRPPAPVGLSPAPVGLSPAPVGLLAVPGDVARSATLLLGKMTVGLVVGEVASAFGIVATICTITAWLKCLSCGLLFRSWDVLPAHMTIIALGASGAFAPCTVNAHLPTSVMSVFSYYRIFATRFQMLL